MTRQLFLVFSLLASVLLWPAVATAEAGMSSRQMFSAVERNIKTAREANAELLSPEYFAKAMKYYKEAKNDFHMSRGSAEGIKSDLVKSNEWLKKAMDATRMGGVAFAAVIQARSNAESADAPRYASEVWTRAEEMLRKAAHKVEEGDVRDAPADAREAADLFQKAELTAIKVNYLGGARSLIKQAEELDADKYAIKTLIDAKQLLQQAERELTENRYDTDYPRDLARRARNEAQHAITITKLAIGVKKKDFSVEDIITNYERPLTNIAGELDIVPSLHDGYDETEQEIITRIRLLDRESQELEQCLLLADERALEIARLSEQLGIKSEKLAAEERFQALLADIVGIFTPEEAEIFRQDKNMIIRMVGLNFDSGKAELKRNHLIMLDKVRKAIELSNTELTTIEGHTDSYGGDESNLVLSEERAQAVVAHLQTRMTLAPGAAMNAVGYGETRPIANNETEAGREKNRRIDVVIQLTK